MAARPFSFESLGIGCKPSIVNTFCSCWHGRYGKISHDLSSLDNLQMTVLEQDSFKNVICWGPISGKTTTI